MVLLIGDRRQRMSVMLDSQVEPNSRVVMHSLSYPREAGSTHVSEEDDRELEVGSDEEMVLREQRLE